MLSGRILIFDSGVGGLSICRHIQQRMPDLAVDYLFDNAFYPYGELSEVELIDRLCRVIACQVKQSPPLLVVIACNSASTVALPALRQMLNVPVVGVVPAIKPAARLSRKKVIGLLATQGTVQRQYTANLARQFASDCQLINIGSRELVELAERKLKGEAVELSRLEEVCRPFLEAGNTPDVVVLGCTHFPLLSDELQSILPASVRLVDSGEAIAQRVTFLLGNKKPQRVGFDHAYFTRPLDDPGLETSLRQQGFRRLSLLKA